MGVTEELRWAAAKLVTLGKFAVDSAVNESLKGGMQVYAIVKGESKGNGLSEKSKADKKQNLASVQEMQAKLEKMQQDMKNIHQQSKVSALGKEEQERFDDNLKSLIPEVTGQRKVFIRSRL